MHAARTVARVDTGVKAELVAPCGRQTPVLVRLAHAASAAAATIMA